MFCDANSASIPDQRPYIPSKTTSVCESERERLYISPESSPVHIQSSRKSKRGRDEAEGGGGRMVVASECDCFAVTCSEIFKTSAVVIKFIEKVGCNFWPTRDFLPVWGKYCELVFRCRDALSYIVGLDTQEEERTLTVGSIWKGAIVVQTLCVFRSSSLSN